MEKCKMLELIARGAALLAAGVPVVRKVINDYSTEQEKNIHQSNQEDIKIIWETNGYSENNSIDNHLKTIKAKIENKEIGISNEQLDMILTGYAFRHSSKITLTLKESLENETNPQERAILILRYMSKQENLVRGFCVFLWKKFLTEKQILQNTNAITLLPPKIQENKEKTISSATPHNKDTQDKNDVLLQSDSQEESDLENTDEAPPVSEKINNSTENKPRRLSDAKIIGQVGIMRQTSTPNIPITNNKTSEEEPKKAAHSI